MSQIVLQRGGRVASQRVDAKSIAESSVFRLVAGRERSPADSGPTATPLLGPATMERHDDETEC